MHLREEVAPLGPSSPFPDHPLPLFSFLPSPLSFLRLSTRSPPLSLSLSLLSSSSSSSFSSLARESIILWPAVAFRNLFVIKAAIYFTLIEEIGRLPLAATIYHVPLSLSLSPPPLSHFIASQEDYTLLKMYSRVCMYDCANPYTGFLRVYMFHLHRSRVTDTHVKRFVHTSECCCYLVL